MKHIMRLPGWGDIPISQDDLATKYQWRTVKIREAGFKGAERLQLPPVQEGRNE